MDRLVSGHSHGAVGRDARPLRIVLGIGLTVLAFQVVGGIASNSLALLADAGHVATDVAGVALALGATWLASRPVSDGRTYGWYRAEIVAAVVNAVLLFGVSGYILWEAWQRWNEPGEVASGLMLVVAVIGGGANLVSLWILREPQAHSLNMRGAYLEVLGDLLGSVAVVVAAIVIAVTGWHQADAVASALIGLMILPRTFHLLREATDILLEAVPKGVDLEDVRRHILDAPGVRAVHDLHIWTITSGMNVVSAHVVMDPDGEPGILLDHLSDCLAGDFDIEHSTFQLETPEHQLWEGKAERVRH
ncbi:MAG: cation transporter [Chloroflexi bacterium]|nr:cation transporter [Chloroflexota bacterium]